MTTLRQLKELYKKGQNISAFLREEQGIDHNTREIIEISYDLQTGSYTESMDDEVTAKFKARRSHGIAQEIIPLGPFNSILEAGVGEATTLSGVLQNLDGNISSYGFDLSWSRVAYAQKWLQGQGLHNTILCTGDLLEIPLLDNSIDVVYTSHAIEPNGGQEEPILRELHRVARKYVVLFEPSYEMAMPEAQLRMQSHGYCKNLPGICQTLGFDVQENKLFEITKNKMNPTAVTIIRKDSAGITQSNQSKNGNVLACPKHKTPLKELGGMLFSPEASLVYPIVGGIPCLRTGNGVLASKYEDVI